MAFSFTLNSYDKFKESLKSISYESAEHLPKSQFEGIQIGLRLKYLFALVLMLVES